jgi:hypothetical protein
MTAFLAWLKGAIATVYGKDGLFGLAMLMLFLCVVFAAVALALTLTPLGAWVAAWLGV